MAKKAKPEEKAPNIVINEISVGQVTRGNQTIQTWFNAVKVAEQQLVPDRRPLYNTYLDVTIDGYLDSLMDKRIRAVKNLAFEWMGLENDKIKDNLAGPWFLNLLGHIQQRIFWGPTLVEFELGADGLIELVKLIPRQNVKPEKGVIMLDGYSDSGDSVIHYREGIYKNFIMEIGETRELGKLANVASYVLMKRQNLSDLSRYNEMFGMDLRVYEYDPTKPDARREAERSAKEYGSAAYIVLPKGYADVKFIASNKQSSSSAYDTFHNILKNEITISVLGQSLTTGGEGGGSFELGKVHMAVQNEIALEDRIVAEYLINYKLKKDILIPHGYPLEGIKGVFKVPDTLAKEIKANMWIALAKAGLPIAKEDFYKEFGVPMPGDREVIDVPADAGSPPPADPEPVDPSNPTKPSKPAGGAGGKKLSSGSAHLVQLRAYYANAPLFKNGITLSYTSELDAIINDIIERIRNGSLKPGAVDPALYELVSERLFAAVQKGFGATIDTGGDVEVATLKALRENVYRFSGFKNYHFVLEANKLLGDAQGNIKPYDLFRSEILALNKEYNIDHLRTEYNHAVATSRMAKKWHKFKDDEGALPLLQFQTVGDGRTRAAHQAFDNVIKPVDDPFWDNWMPPLDYNCRCTVRQLAEGEISGRSDFGEPKKGFGVNWGKKKVVFPPSHPQFDVEPDDEKNSQNNFGLSIPD